MHYLHRVYFISTFPPSLINTCVWHFPSKNHFTNPYSLIIFACFPYIQCQPYTHNYSIAEMKQFVNVISLEPKKHSETTGCCKQNFNTRTLIYCLLHLFKRKKANISIFIDILTSCAIFASICSCMNLTQKHYKPFSVNQLG